MRNHAFKKMLAGVLAVLTVAAVAPVNVVNGGGFADSVAIVAKASQMIDGFEVADSYSGETYKDSGVYFELNTLTGELKVSGTTPNKSIGQYYFLSTATSNENDKQFATEYCSDDINIDKYKLSAAILSTVKTVHIANNIRSIGGAAFGQLPNLERVVMDEGLTSLAISAFRDCPKLSYIEIPSTCASIDKGAFWNSKYGTSGGQDLKILNKSSLQLTKAMFCYYLDGTSTPSANTVIEIEMPLATDAQLIDMRNDFNRATVTANGRISPSIGVEVEDDGYFNVNLYVPKTDHNSDLNKFTAVINNTDCTFTPITTGDMADNYSMYTVKCKAKEMTKDFNITLKYDGVAGYKGTASIASYLKNVIATPKYSAYHNASKAMLHYGAAAQVYFGETDTTKLADYGVTDGMYATDETASKKALADFVGKTTAVLKKADVNGSDAIKAANNALKEQDFSGVTGTTISYHSMTMKLAEDPCIIMYFRVNGGADTDAVAKYLDGKLTLGGTGCSVKQNNALYITVTSSPIGIKNFASPIELKYDNGTGFSVSSKNYVAGIKDSDKPSLRNVCNALINFYTEASKISS